MQNGVVCYSEHALTLCCSGRVGAQPVPTTAWPAGRLWRAGHRPAAGFWQRGSQRQQRRRRRRRRRRRVVLLDGGRRQEGGGGAETGGDGVVGSLRLHLPPRSFARSPATVAPGGGERQKWAAAAADRCSGGGRQCSWLWTMWQHWAASRGRRACGLISQVLTGARPLRTLSLELFTSVSAVPSAHSGEVPVVSPVR